MKVHFFRTPALIFIIFGSITACYSAEFFPAADYPGLRRRSPESVDLLAGRPHRPVSVIGRLVVKDAAADVRDPNFRRFLENEIAALGGDGAWVQAARLVNLPGLRTGERQSDGYVQPGEELPNQVREMQLIVFVYADEDAP